MIDVAGQATSGRIGNPALDLAVTLLLQIVRDSSKCTTRTCRADEGVETARQESSLVPDLRSGRVNVRLSIAFKVADGRKRTVSVRGRAYCSLHRSLKLVDPGEDKKSTGYTEHTHLCLAYHAALSRRSACLLASAKTTHQRD